MLSFSQRLGIKPSIVPYQRETADKDLRSAIWNVLYTFILEQREYTHYIEEADTYFLLKRIWGIHFNLLIDEIINDYDEHLSFLKKKFFNCEWFEFFDLIEFIEQNYEHKYGEKQEVTKRINSCLEKHNSAYRLINGQFTEITNKNEIQEIEKAINQNPFLEVQTHLSQAIVLMNNREKPDFRNSINESISAIESLVKKITNNPSATFSNAIAEIKKKKEIHPAYEEAFKKLYGWTSDDGIRHGKFRDTEHTLADARFMLVVCSAFTNYLIDVTK